MKQVIHISILFALILIAGASIAFLHDRVRVVRESIAMRQQKIDTAPQEVLRVASLKKELGQLF